MIAISTLTLTIYLFGFLGSPNEQRVASAARSMYRKLMTHSRYS